MNQSELEIAIKKAIVDIAPDVIPEDLGPEDDIRDELDLDSMDFLNIIIAVSKETGVNIPESDYSKVLTLKDLCDYIESKLIH